MGAPCIPLHSLFPGAPASEAVEVLGKRAWLRLAHSRPMCGFAAGKAGAT